MKLFVCVLLMSISTLTLAKDEIPLDEHGFVNMVKTLKIDKIAELLGEPQKHYELKDERTGAVIGQVWQYEYLNIAENGDYYPTTELDIVDDHVATVVFMNDPQGEKATTPAPLEAEPELPEIPANI